MTSKVRRYLYGGIVEVFAGGLVQGLICISRLAPGLVALETSTHNT